MTYTKVKEELILKTYIKINIVAEKRDEQREPGKDSTSNTENKNVTLNDPGAAVVDYGRASQGNMENQQGDRATSTGKRNKSGHKNEDIDFGR